MVGDPIADFLVRLKNAARAGHERVDLPSSRLKAELAQLLKAEGFLTSWKVVADHRQGQLRLQLKYSAERTPVLKGARRISTPGRRVYRGWKELGKYPRKGDLGTLVLSTSRGLKTDRAARREKLGGELLLEVW